MDKNPEDLGKSITGELEKKIKTIDRTLALTVFVLLVGFVTMIVAMLSVFISATSERNASYQALTQQVQQVNDKLSK